MKTKINDKFIEKWHPKYDILEKDEEYYQNILCEVKIDIRSKKTLSEKTFKKIINWKAKRAKGKIEWANFNKYSEQVRKCLDKNLSDTEKIKILDDLKGIGAPIATTILHFIFPKEIPIMDIRTVEVLYINNWIESLQRTVRNFQPFKEAILTIKSNCPKWSLRQIDRALFTFHKIKKAKKCCRKY